MDMYDYVWLYMIIDYSYVWLCMTRDGPDLRFQNRLPDHGHTGPDFPDRILTYHLQDPDLPDHNLTPDLPDRITILPDRLCRTGFYWTGFAGPDLPDRILLNRICRIWAKNFFRFTVSFFTICQAFSSNNSRNNEQYDMKFIRHHRGYVGNRCLKLQLRDFTIGAVVDPDPAGYLIEFLQIYCSFFYICLAFL